jgi:uncharacterized protein YqjF (DUF2071 family)
LNNSSTETDVKQIEASRPGGLSLSALAKARMQGTRGEPLFIADWDNVLMIHFAVDAKPLQRDILFELDMREGRAFVTLVAFTMREMRLAFGGRLTSWVFRPMATHDFLNVRTYVRMGSDAGIHFLAEWVSNRLAVALGPRSFSLPYRHGIISYHNDWSAGELCGRVEDAGTGAAFAYQADLEVGAPLSECDPGSLDQWLMERYSAYNSACARKRFFHVWHEPWLQCQARVEMTDASLLESNWEWFRDAEFVGANYSPCVHGVWLGRPHCVNREN